MGVAVHDLPSTSQDKRWRLVDVTMRRLGYEPQGLIEALHTVQDAYGYIDQETLRKVATRLQVPLSQAYGVATFYHYFTLKPAGKHSCVICMGTACYIKHAQELLAALAKKFGLKPGETTPDGNVSLLTARCFGACGLAPCVAYDGVIAGKISAKNLVDKVNTWVHPIDAQAPSRQ